MAARYHVPRRQRSPRARHDRALQQQIEVLWTKRIAEVLADGVHRRLLPLPIDGLVLVESRSIEYGHHEVRLHGRVAVHCTGPCGAHPACFHRAAVGIASYLEEMAAVMGTTPAHIHVERMPVAEVRRVIANYLTPAPTRRRFGPGAQPDSLPESPYTGPEPVAV